MTITNGYCTLSEFKQFITPPDQTLAADIGDDSVIEMLIESSSRFIDGECVRHFYKSSADETRYYTADDTSYCRVDDLVSVTALYTDDGSREYADTWTTDDYDLWPYNASADGRPYVQIVQAPYSNYWFPAGTAKGVKVTGIFGYPSVPTQIKDAYLIITLSAYKRRYGENLSSVSTVTAGGVIITPQDVPAGAWAKLNPFRRRI